jgi:mannose-1-phosphate guanylyltransferase
MRYAVIMAGGAGTRFWPSSRQAKPKQFLNLLGERSMIQSTVDRILPLIPMERILVVTNAHYVDLVKQQFPDMPAENIIGEPIAKNTAPCVAAAAAILLKRDPNATMIVLPADHHITKPKRFLEILETGMEKAESGKNLVTIGITPHRPETGYGYIQLDESQIDNSGKDPVFIVKTFAEKPDLKTAITFLQSGDFLWNSGMFIWKADTILEQFQLHQPVIYREVEVFQSEMDANFDEALKNFYNLVTSISIDYGIMEKTDAVHVIPSEFGWSDVGSWFAVYEHGHKDENGNVVQDETTILHDVQNCLVKTHSKKLVAMVGMMGVGVIETEDSIVVLKLDSSQDIKKIVDNLDQQGLKTYK